MANNVSSSSSKIGSFLERNVRLLVGIIVVVIVFVAVVVLSSSVRSKSVAKGLSSIDSIEYAFRKDTDGLSEEEFAARQDKALDDLEQLVSKGGIVGVRANMLKGEILFEKKDYEQSRSAWAKAADAKKGIYTAPICNYNAAVCSENLNDLDGALAYYEKAAGSKDFYLVDHAYFSIGRVNEAKGDYDAALAAYGKVEELHPSSRWTPVAKDRIIAIKANGSANQ